MTDVTLTGTGGNDIFETVQMGYATSISFRVDGGNGNDIIRTSDGDDFVDGGKGEDTIYGGGGDDILRAGNHDDYVNAGHGNDYVSGGAGNDILYAGAGNDEVLGGSGNDMIYGQKGYNTLDGGIGDDFINTGRHNSTAIGGEGNDTIVADISKGARHILNGGDGADSFEFVGANAKRSSITRIEDFELGIDSFTFGSSSDLDIFADYLADPANAGVTFVDGDEGAELAFASRDMILFEGLSVSEVSAHYDAFLMV